LLVVDEVEYKEAVVLELVAEKESENADLTAETAKLDRIRGSLNLQLVT